MEDIENSISLMEIEKQIELVEKEVRSLIRKKESKLLIIEDLRELMSKVAEENSFYKQMEENKNKLRINDIFKFKENSIKTPRKFSEDTFLSKIHSVSTVDSHTIDNC